MLIISQNLKWSI